MINKTKYLFVTKKRKRTFMSKKKKEREIKNITQKNHQKKLYKFTAAIKIKNTQLFKIKKKINLINKII